MGVIKTNLFKNIPKNAFFLSLPIIALIGVFIFNVLYFPAYARYIQINYINSSLIIALLILILSFGIILGRSNYGEELYNEVENKLTAREREIVLLILKKKKNIEIANALFVELSTIKSHINNIYKKENVKNRKEIIVKYNYLNKTHSY